MNQPAPRSGRGRRPAAQVREGVLTAAGDILFDTGLSGITFDKVAKRAGSSKMTLYRWWPSPGALALEAYFAATEPTLAFQDTGDIERDLAGQLRSFIRLLISREEGAVITELIGAAQLDPDLASAMTDSYTRPRRRLAVDRIVIAQRHAQIRRDVDPEVVVDQLWGACYQRLLLPGPALTEDFADVLVTNLFVGIREPEATGG